MRNYLPLIYSKYSNNDEIVEIVIEFYTKFTENTDEEVLLRQCCTDIYYLK